MATGDDGFPTRRGRLTIDDSHLRLHERLPGGIFSRLAGPASLLGLVLVYMFPELLIPRELTPVTVVLGGAYAAVLLLTGYLVATGRLTDAIWGFDQERDIPLETIDHAEVRSSMERGLELRAIPKTRPVLVIVRTGDHPERIVRSRYLYEEARMDEATAYLEDHGITVQDVR